MSWYWWVLIGIGALLLVMFFKELPAIRRYLRMKSM